MKINDVWDLLHVEDLIATNSRDVVLQQEATECTTTFLCEEKLGKLQDPLGSYQI